MNAALDIVTNGPGESNAWFRRLAEWERDSLPELPPPQTYADYERARREQAGVDRYTPLEFAR